MQKAYPEMTWALSPKKLLQLPSGTVTMVTMVQQQASQKAQEKSQHLLDFTVLNISFNQNDSIIWQEQGAE